MSVINSYKQRRPKNTLNTGSPSLNSVLNFEILKDKVEKSIKVKTISPADTSKKKRPTYRFRGSGDKDFYL